MMMQSINCSLIVSFSVICNKSGSFCSNITVLIHFTLMITKAKMGIKYLFIHVTNYVRYFIYTDIFMLRNNELLTLVIVTECDL